MAEMKKTPRMTTGLSRYLFYFIQFSWGLPVNLIGGLVYLALYPFCRHERFRNAFISYLPKKFGGLSLGLFVFIAADRDPEWTRDPRIHEYGHTIQCLLLGPLYWVVIGIPSAVWCNCFEGYRKRRNVSYYALYCESWANKWGERWSGLRRRERG